MRTTILVVSMLMFTMGLGVAADGPETFYSYVDSSICARLMLGPITQERIECSQDTSKNGDSPALVRLSNNMVLEVNKHKMVKPLVGGFANVTGTTKVKAGKIKLESAEPVEVGDIPAGDPARQLLDVRNFRASETVYNQVRHALAMMPYISEFDFISFTMNGDTVILTGWTVRLTNRQEAYNRVKVVEGVGAIVNNIEVLPMGRNDMNVRAGARARLQQHLSRYFWGSGSDIKIIVKNGRIILLGTVSTEGDKNLANIQCNQVPGAFHVFNLLRVEKG